MQSPQNSHNDDQKDLIESNEINVEDNSSIFPWEIDDTQYHKELKNYHSIGEKRKSEDSIVWYKNLWFIISLISIIFLSTISILTQIFIVPHYSEINVSGTSMEPRLHNDDFVILHKSSYKHENIIVFKKPDSWVEDPSKNVLLVKRIGALPGDILTINNNQNGGTISVNNHVIRTMNKGFCQTFGTYTHKLSPNEIFALGDNVKVSLDSRHNYCTGHKNVMYINKDETKVTGHITFVAHNLFSFLK